MSFGKSSITNYQKGFPSDLKSNLKTGKFLYTFQQKGTTTKKIVILKVTPETDPIVMFPHKDVIDRKNYRLIFFFDPERGGIGVTMIKTYNLGRLADYLNLISSYNLRKGTNYSISDVVTTMTFVENPAKNDGTSHVIDFTFLVNENDVPVEFNFENLKKENIKLDVLDETVISALRELYKEIGGNDGLFSYRLGREAMLRNYPHIANAKGKNGLEINDAQKYHLTYVSVFKDATDKNAVNAILNESQNVPLIDEYLEAPDKIKYLSE